MSRGRKCTSRELKDLERYTKRLRYNGENDKKYWEIIQDGTEVVGTASYSMFKDYNKGE